jgi:hypothetical protein
MSIVFCLILLFDFACTCFRSSWSCRGKRVGFKGEILLGFLLTLLWAGYLEGV